MRFKQRRGAGTIRQSVSSVGANRCHTSTLEVLEGRAMLAGNTAAALAPWHNQLKPLDVNHDGYVSPADALMIIDDLRIHGSHAVASQGATPLAAAAGTSAGTSSVNYLDVNGDNMVSPADLLRVIDALATPATATLVTVSTVYKDMNGQPITSPITIGTQFQVETDVLDTSGFSPPGVFSAFLNFAYDQSVASVDNPPGGQIPTAGAFFNISGNKPLDLSVHNQITNEGANGFGTGPILAVTAKFGGGAAVVNNETFTVNGVTFTLSNTLPTGGGIINITSGMTSAQVATAIKSAVGTSVTGVTAKIDPANTLNVQFVNATTLTQSFNHSLTANTLLETLFTFTATATNSGTETFTPSFVGGTGLNPWLLDGQADPNQSLTTNQVLFSPPPSLQVVSLPLVSVNPGPSINEANSGTTPFVFTVSLSQAINSPVTVQYATADGTAKTLPNAQNDYQATSGTLTFLTTDPLTKLVTVLVNADPHVEGPETFSLVLSNPSSSALLSPNSAAVGTILNDSVSIVGATVDSSGTTPALFTVSLSQAPKVAVTVNYSVTPGTGAFNNDYLTPTVNGIPGLTGTLTFAPNVTTQVISVPIKADIFPDTVEDFHVNLSSPTNAILANGLTTETATGTINPVVQIPVVSITPLVSLPPNGNPFTNFVFTASLSNPVNSETLFVDYTTVDGTGPNGATVANGDYTATSGTLTFLPGTTSQTVTVQVLHKTASGPNESFTIDLTPDALSPDVTGTPIGTGTILNERATPTLSVSSPTVTPGAVGTNALFTVSLTFPVNEVVTVPYATHDNTAQNGVDYQAVSGQLTFTPSDSSLTQIITVPILGQTTAAADETFFLNLSPPSPTGGAVIATPTAVGTIVRQGITISDASAAPGRSAVFTVTLIKAQDVPVTVSYNTVDGTGPNAATVADSDYTATSGTLTFAAGDTTKFITVAVLPDSRTEPNETFFVNLSNPTGNVQLLSGQAVGTITHPLIVTTVIKDMAGNVITSPITIGTQFKVETDVQDNRNPVATLPGVFDAYLNFTYQQSVAAIDNPGVQAPIPGAGFAIFGSGSGSKPLDTTSVPNQITDEGAFSVGANPSTPVVQTLFTFTATATNSGTETFTPFFDSVASHDTLLYGNTTPLTNNDISFSGGSVQIVALPLLSVNPGPSINEANSGTTPFVFTVSLSQSPTTSVRVPYTTVDGTGANAATAADGDYNATSGTLTFTPTGPLTQLVTVMVNADSAVESPETFSLALSNPLDNNAQLSPNSAAVGTILNDSVSIVGATVDSSGTTPALFTVSLSQAPKVAVTVNYSVTPGTGAFNNDYLTPTVNGIPGLTGTLTFAPNVTTQVISVPIKADIFPDTVEDFHVNLSSPTNAILANGLTTETATGTINPVVQIPVVSITPLVSLPPNGNPFTNFVFTASLSNPVNSETLFVDYTTVDGTGPNGATVANGDYTATSGTLTFLPGTTSQTVTVQVLHKTASGPNESFTIDLTPDALSPDVTGTPIGTGTILNERATPTLSVSSPTVTPGAVGTNALFTVSLTFPVTEVVTVPYATADNTAQKSVDYQAVSGQLTFTPTDSSLTQVITVPIIGQTTAAADESFFLNLSPPTPTDGAVIATPTAVGTIVRQGITITDASATPGSSAVFTVTLTRAQDHMVKVPFTTADNLDPVSGATVADGDYTATSNTLTFLANETTKFITVAVLPDSRTEANETFFVNLSNPTGNVQLLSGHATGTILNQQGQLAAVQLKLADTNGNLLGANSELSKGTNFLLEAFVTDTQPVPTGIFQTYLNAVYDSRLVSITPGGTIKYGQTYQQSGQSFQTFSDGQTGNLSTLGQINDAGAIQTKQWQTLPSSPDPNLPNLTKDKLLFSIPLTATNFGAADFSVGLSTQQGHDVEEFFTNGVPANSVNVVNTQANPLVLNIGSNVIAVSNVSHTRGASGTTTNFVFDVTRFLPDNTPATVVFSTSDGTAHAPPNGNDYVATSLTLAPFLASLTGAAETQQVTVVVNGNSTVAPPETFFVNLTAPTGVNQTAQISAVAGVGTIQSNFPPQVAIAGDSKFEGDLLTFPVTLSAPSTLQATVAYTVTPPPLGNISGPTSGTLTFLAGHTTPTQPLTVQSVFTIAQQADETFTVVLSNPSNAVLAVTPDQATGTIKRIPPATITGLVYVDLNNNGRPDASEVGIPNVTVTATPNGSGNPTTTTTDANGVFSFTTLQPGTYTIKETQPGFFVDGIDSHQGTVSSTNDQFSNIMVVSNGIASGFDFGEQGLRAQFAAAFLNRRAYFASSIVTGELGSQMNPSAINLQKGDIWVSFDNGLPGLNVIQALFQPSQGSVTMNLYDSNLNLVAMSTPTSSGSQIAYTGTGGTPYFLHISGSNPSVSLQVIGSGTSASSQTAAPAARALSTTFAPALAAVTPAASTAATDAALTQENDWAVELLLA